MSSKRKRLEEQLLVAPVAHEVDVTLPAFVASAPKADASNVEGRCASLSECYLVYCYLCRTGAHTGAAAWPQRARAQSRRLAHTPLTAARRTVGGYLVASLFLRRLLPRLHSGDGEAAAGG